MAGFVGNPNTQTREFSVRDPDGYYVTIRTSRNPKRRALSPFSPDLTALFGPAEDRHERRVDELAVEIVLGLVNQQR